jgi:hypothetical protein
MKNLRRRRCLEFSMIAAALALVAGTPAGALAAGEESGGGSTGETVVESPGGSTQPAAPATPPAAPAPPSTGWTSPGAGTGTSGGGSTPVRHGSSVGSGGAPEKAGSTGEEPPQTSGSSGSSSAPEPSTPSTFKESASTPRAGSGARPVKPRVTAAASPTAHAAGRAVNVAVGAATPLALPKPSPARQVTAGTPAAAATLTDPGSRAASGSFAVPLLALVLLGLILCFAGVRLWRQRERRRLRARWQRQDAAWEEAIRQIEMEQSPGASGPNAEQLQRIDVG